MVFVGSPILIFDFFFILEFKAAGTENFARTFISRAWWIINLLNVTVSSTVYKYSVLVILKVLSNEN
jgi:hypothetical protein